MLCIFGIYKQKYLNKVGKNELMNGGLITSF